MPLRFPIIRLSQLLAVLLTGAAYLALAYATPRSQFGQVLGLFGVAGAAYAWLLHTRLPLRWGLGAALLFRLLWLPATPALSDDFYRFRWDGLLSSHGQNVFAATPHQVLFLADRAGPRAAATLPLAELRRLYPKLNSPDYYSVYPPVGQLLYRVAATAYPASQTGFLALVRVALLLADVGAALLLLRLLPAASWPARRALGYLLHPLVIVEVAGNVHMEGVVVFFLLLMGWLLWRRQAALAGAALALAVATKLLPLLALPLLARRLSWPRHAWLGGAFASALLLLFAPYLAGSSLSHIGQSLRLYFHLFEFNASLFYLLRATGQTLTGANQIDQLGPALALTTTGLLLTLAARERRPTLATLPQALLLALTGYYALATTVHPWYLVPLVALSCFSPRRYAIVWAGLIVLSYATYRTLPYAENPLLTSLEYAGVLAWALGETYFSDKSKAHAPVSRATPPDRGPNPRPKV